MNETLRNNNQSVFTYGRVEKVKRGRHGVTKILIKRVEFVIDRKITALDSDITIEVSANSLTKGISEHFVRNGKVMVKGRVREGWQTLSRAKGMVLDAISIGE